MSANITSGQRTRLQVLYAQYARKSLDASPSREDRLSWAAAQAGRQIDSFSDLTADEARRLIDGLQAELGVKAPAAPRPRLDRRAAHNAGTAGRHDQTSAEITLASAADHARIKRVMVLMGWDGASLRKFLGSTSSPLAGRMEVRTLADANKLWWALKRIAKKKGMWKEEPRRQRA
jgi:hypothetical protein